MRQRCWSAAAGFSLLEAIVACALLVAGVLALVQVLVIALQATSAATHITVASLLAAQKLEELRSAAWGETVDGEDRVGGYTRRWSVVPFPPHPARALVLTVDVAPGGVRLATLRARTAP